AMSSSAAGALGGFLAGGARSAGARSAGARPPPAAASSSSSSATAPPAAAASSSSREPETRTVGFSAPEADPKPRPARPPGQSRTVISGLNTSSNASALLGGMLQAQPKRKPKDAQTTIG
ncbi:unnamed protein product, partial [Polarella glacialis]